MKKAVFPDIGSFILLVFLLILCLPLLLTTGCLNKNTISPAQQKLSDFRFRYPLKVGLPKENPVLEELTAKYPPVDEHKLTKVLFGTHVKINRKTENGIIILNSGKKHLTIYPSGGYEYSMSDSPENAVTLTETEAVKLAKDTLRKCGGLPQDLGEPEVSTMNRSHILPDGRSVTENTYYFIDWKKDKVNGISAGRFYRIKVAVNSAGVNWIIWEWPNIVAKGKKVKFISAEQVIIKSQTYDLGFVSQPITGIEPYYYTPNMDTFSGVIKPAWQLSFGGEKRYFDATTGDLI